jgi:hypothetical protein
MIFKRAVAKLRAQDWAAITIELVIVTLGVLIALAAQQWAEERSWSDKINADKAALRDELGEHYGYAVEYRVVYPCLQAQVDRLRERVQSSAMILDPAPIYHEADVIKDDYVLRMPTKYYPTDAWQEAMNDGVVQRLDPATRRQFAGHYASLVNVAAMNELNGEAERQLMVLGQPLRLDPSVRYSLIGELTRLSGRLQWLDTQNGQVIDYIAHIGMVPSAAEAQAVTMRYGTYLFCKAHRLPMRPFKEAMEAVPN